jgi:hypothetical protein
MIEFANYFNQLKDHFPIYIKKQRFYYFRTKFRISILKYFQYINRRTDHQSEIFYFHGYSFKKILIRSEKLKVTISSRDTNGNRPLYFYQFRTSQGQLAPARINYNNVAAGNTPGRQ